MNENYIFDAPVTDISFDEILSQKENREGLLVCLSPLVNLECSRTRYKLVEKLMQFYIGLPDKLKESVVFLGSVNEISNLIDYQPDFGDMLLNNPSISKALIA